MEKKKKSAEKAIKEIKRNTRRKFSAEEKIRIVLEGLRGEESVSAICRKEGIHANLYYTRAKNFMEAGKKRLNGDTKREANTDEVRSLRDENDQLKRHLAELYLENQLIKKSQGG